MKEIAEAVDLLRHHRGLPRDVVEAEYRDGSRIGKLSQVRFGTNPETGRPTRRMIDCLNDGRPRCYDKNFRLEITAWIIYGERMET